MSKKKAEMSILGALIAFALIVLMCPVFEFYNISKKTEIAENSIKATLRDVCVSDSIVRYNDIKFMAANIFTIDEDNYEEAIFDSLGYTNKNLHEWAKNDIKISNFSLEYNSGSRTFIAKYDISIPFKILNKTIKTSTVSKKSIIAFEQILTEQKGNADTLTPEEPVDDLRRNGIIPEGGTYTVNETKTVLTAGESFPDVPVVGDTYEEGDYKYTYTTGASEPVVYVLYKGWTVNVKSKEKIEYGLILLEIAGEPTVNVAGTFANCTSLLKAPAIPSTVLSLDGAFKGCTSLSEAPIIPEGVLRMKYTFYGCSSLSKSPGIPNGVLVMLGTFQNCVSLETAPIIPSSVYHMSFMFQNCTSLEAAPVISSGVKYMSYAFSGCTSLVNPPQIPNSVESMEYTFEDCTSLTSAPIIPSGVTTMDRAFYGCTSLSGSIEVNTNPTSYSGCLKNTKITTITGSCSQATKDALLKTK